MGCDIHLYVERLENGKWIFCDTWETEDGYTSVPYEKQFYNGRNYNLFAILADVRNGRGFAGVETGTGFHPIHDLRGIPENASPEVQAVADQWDTDGHSRSWATVEELMAFDWTQKTTLIGWLDGWSFAEWENWKRGRGESPKEWCGGVSGGSIRHISEDQMRKEIMAIRGEGRRIWDVEKEIQTKLGQTYCRSEWTQFYYQCTGSFLGETLPKLWRLGKPSEVRIVYFFDN